MNILQTLLEGEAYETALAAKAKEHGIKVNVLKQVYKRGLAAWDGKGSQHAWAMGRVNSFCTGEGGARKADADLWDKR